MTNNKTQITKTISLLLLALLYAVPVQTAEEVNFPAYHGYVNDFAGVISAQDKHEIEALAGELDTKTTAQIAVVTLNTTSPLSIEQYAVDLFEKWGIGKKGKDNGVLILMAVNDRAVRIEVGYGLEGAIPDAIASRIITGVMIPEFKKGGLSNGLLLGTASIASLAAKEYNITLSEAENYANLTNTASQAPARSALEIILILIMLFLIFGTRSGLLFYFIFGGSRKGRGMWYGSGGGGSSGSFGGGFGGFGGGMSGGGGASGRW